MLKFILIIGILSFNYSNKANGAQVDCSNFPQSTRKLLNHFSKGIKNEVRSDVTHSEFVALLERGIPSLRVLEATHLIDASFAKKNSLKEVHLGGMKQLTNQCLKYLGTLDYLRLENCPQITYEGVLSLKNLKRLYLWNMPHFTDKHLAILRDNNIRVFDGRHKRSKLYHISPFPK